MSTHADIPDWKCERYLLDELDPAEMEAIRQAARDDESLRARLEAIERSNRELLEKYPPAGMTQRIREELGTAQTAVRSTRRGWRIPRMALVPAGLVAVVALAMLALPMLPTEGPTDSEVTRIKGSGSQLRLHRKTDEGSQQLENGDSAAEHDLILIQYQMNEPAYGAILSVDGRGTITAHLPVEGNQAVAVEPGRPHSLDFAYELDDAPRWEIFFFVTSASPFETDRMMEALERSPFMTRALEVLNVRETLEGLDLPDDFHVSEFLLVKDPRHEN